MSFVHPLLLGGLCALAIPVALHLIMRRKPKHLPFPAVRFLIQRQRVNQRKLQLRHLLLLAARMALLAIICLALARPKIFSNRLNLSADRPVAAVFLFDTSYSMEYTSGDRTRLDEAKRRALEILATLPTDSQVAVLDTAEGGGEWLRSPSAVRDRISSLKLRPANAAVTTRLPEAYDLLGRLPSEADGSDERPPTFLYLFSDRTVRSWEAGRLKDLRSLRDRVGDVYSVYVDVGVDHPVDIAVVGLEMPRQAVPAGDAVVVHATVQATGEACDAEIVCRFDGEERADRKPLRLAAGESRVITFERPGLSRGWHQAEVGLRGADKTLPFNNTRFASFEVQGPRRVLIISDEPRTAFFWRVALSQRIEHAAGLSCDIKSTREAERLFPDRLRADYQAVCLLSVANPGRDLWDKLRSYVENGGGLAVIPGGQEFVPAAYDTDSARAVLPGRPVSHVTAPRGRGADWDWSANNFQHPIMRGFHEARRDEATDFVQYPRAATDYWEVKPYPDATVVVAYADDKHRPALLERTFPRTVNPGRVVLFTTPLDGREPRWNDYLETLTSFYFVLAHLTVGYLAGDATDGNFNYQSGQTVPVALPASGRFPTYTIQGPGLEGTDTIAQRPERQSELLLSRPTLPGNYKVYGEDGAPVGAFSLNVAADECQLGRVPRESIEELLGPGAVLALDRSEDLQHALQKRWSQPLELMPVLLILLLLLLALENLLANLFYRRDAEHSAAPEGGVPA